MGQCKYFKNCGIRGGGCCTIGEYNGKPTHLACEKLCDKRDESAKEIIQKPPTAPAPSRIEIRGPEPVPIPMPPVSEQLINLKDTVKGVIQGKLKGQHTFASREEKEARLEVCNGCDLFNKERQRCSKCGCYMKAKSQFKASKCPLGKWPT
jgi:hypothetical protein